MVTALGTPKRRPKSGFYLFRKCVPEQLRESVGKREIKFSLRTRDPVVARIRNLEEMARSRAHQVDAPPPRAFLTSAGARRRASERPD